jgi:hypothetical protein
MLINSILLQSGRAPLACPRALNVNPATPHCWDAINPGTCAGWLERLQVPLKGWQWQVAVACGSLKGGRADWLVEKSVELNAADFIPLLTHRSPVIGSSSGGSGGGSGGGGGSPGKRDRRQAQKKGRGGGGAEELGTSGEPASCHDEAAEGGREGRWQRLATAALKQSLRAHAMRVHAPSDVQVRPPA